MNKSELIDAVAEASSLEKVAVGRVIDAIIASITGALKTGDEVRLLGFGTFSISERAEATGRNPRTNEAIKIAASKNAKFKPGKSLKDDLNP